MLGGGRAANEAQGFRATQARVVALARRAGRLAMNQRAGPYAVRLISLHRASALLLLTFVLLHVANHLVSLQSVALHLAVMSALRNVYRRPVVEFMVLACAAFQAASGLALVARGWFSRTGFVARLQRISGAYLAFFLIAHVSAVLYGRLVLGLDTNFYYAAAGLHVHPFAWFFAPYYFLAVLALFVHLGCASYWRCLRSRRRATGWVLLASAAGAGVIVSLLITASLGGAFETFRIPHEYTATYGAR